MTPYIGYKKAAELAKLSLTSGQPIKSLVESQRLMDPGLLETVLDPIKMTYPPS